MGTKMSHKHCKKHGQDATNGCPMCRLETAHFHPCSEYTHCGGNGSIYCEENCTVTRKSQGHEYESVPCAICSLGRELKSEPVKRETRTVDLDSEQVARFNDTITKLDSAWEQLQLADRHMRSIEEVLPGGFFYQYLENHILHAKQIIANAIKERKSILKRYSKDNK